MYYLYSNHLYCTFGTHHKLIGFEYLLLGIFQLNNIHLVLEAEKFHPPSEYIKVGITFFFIKRKVCNSFNKIRIENSMFGMKKKSPI